MVSKRNRGIAPFFNAIILLGFPREVLSRVALSVKDDDNPSGSRTDRERSFGRGRESVNYSRAPLSISSCITAQRGRSVSPKIERKVLETP